MNTKDVRFGARAWSVWSAGLALAALSTGCLVQAVNDETEAVAESGEELNVFSTQIWPQLSLSVCWESPSAQTATERGWVQDQITKTWQASSQMKFTGWQACTAAGANLRIEIVNTTSSTGVLVGKQLNGVPGGVKLNLKMTEPQEYVDCKNRFGLQACVRATATHEFGHALGFAHEHMRLDNPNFDCFDLIGGGLGDHYVGTYDLASIMRTCTVRDSAPATLSATDKLGLQAYYGHPSPAAFKKEAIGWNGSIFYFFFGNNLGQFDVALNHMLHYTPAPTPFMFPGWPSASPWSSGVDAAVDYSSTKLYFFSGSQYLRVSKSNFTVDAGYPRTLPGGWSNWPATWTSVDSAIKWKNGRIYLFRGSEYLRLTGTTVDAGYPKPIAGNWNIPYTTGFDYAFIWPGNTKAYFFKGQDYIRVDITGAVEQVDPGYPLKIVGRWPGVTF